MSSCARVKRDTSCISRRRPLTCAKLPHWTDSGYTLRSVVRPTSKYVDERLDHVQLQNAKNAVTPVTEQNSSNVHNETNACDQVQHALFRAVVGKLQFITGVRRDPLFEAKCLSYKLAPPTLADLTRAKKALRYLKGTRHMNLHLTIPSSKPNGFCKEL